MVYGGQGAVTQGHHYTFLGAFAKLRKATIRFAISVCKPLLPSVWNNSAPTGRIFMKFDIRRFFEKNLSKKIKFH